MTPNSDLGIRRKTIYYTYYRLNCKENFILSKNAYESCTIDLELARRQNFFFAAKLVRGAYMEQERERARQIGYEDPINPTYEATSDMYHKNLEYFMQKIIETGIENKKIAIMVATHNEDTVRFTVNK